MSAIVSWDFAAHNGGYPATTPTTVLSSLMPIKVQCACGAAFAAKDELAGRTVKCPKCQQPLAIPAAGAAPAAAVAAAAPRQMAAPLPSQAAPGKHPAGDLFAEAGLHAQQAGTLPCPGCANPMPINAVVCIKCGYNKKIGRRMEVIKQTGGPAIPGGHTVSVEEMLGKAAVRIEEEKEEERKKTKEGMPWWVYLVAMSSVLGFMITMMFLPQEMVLRTAPFIVYGLASIVSLYAWVRILIIAFEEGVGHGIGCLVCGLYMLVYSILRWDRCGTLFLLMFFTNILANILAFGIGFMLQSLEDPDARAVPERPPVVESFDASWRPITLQKSRVA